MSPKSLFHKAGFKAFVYRCPADSAACPGPTLATSVASPCSGWAPASGKWKGTGHSCAKWGYTEAWCYVVANYSGPFYEFIKPSDTYPDVFWIPCGSIHTATFRANGTKTANTYGSVPPMLAQIHLCGMSCAGVTKDIMAQRAGLYVHVG